MTAASSARPRAMLVITGSELVRGDRTDLNGPYLARELLGLGVEPARLTIVGDAVVELEDALRDGLRADLCVTSGGLGPTHDDRTAELVARVAGVPMEERAELVEEIGGISRAFAERMRRPYADFEEGVRKQATLPAGAQSLGLAGTAPGFVLRAGTCVVVVLPGPPRELQRLWERARDDAGVRAVLARAERPERRVLRFFGASESAVARALADAGGDGDGVEATICARDFEIHVDLFVSPGAEERALELEERVVAPVAQHLYAREERSVEELVLERCRAQGLRLAAAESCTGGMVTSRLTGVPGSSDVFVGGIVAYANEVKERELGVPRAVLSDHGAVSAEAAAAMAAGARERLRADVAIAVTGVAGPGGGTAAKPVGRVYFHASGPDGDAARELDLPGDRDEVRRRATTIALHLVRRVLTQS